MAEIQGAGAARPSTLSGQGRTFPDISSSFYYFLQFSLISSSFSPQFGPPGGQLTHSPGKTLATSLTERDKALD